MEVLDARGGQYIEITYPGDFSPGNVYQVASHQPMLDGTPHDRQPWRKIRAFKGGPKSLDSKPTYLHPLNECRVVDTTKEED